MVSVTKRVNDFKQPRGGYLPIKEFETIQLEDNLTLSEDENINPGLIGLCVDYLSRYLLVGNIHESFRIPYTASHLINEDKHALSLINQIKGLDDQSIIAACQLCGYDVLLRAGNKSAFVPAESIQPNQNVINNIKVMVNRTLDVFKNYFKDIVLDGFTFKGGYSSIISSGDGDYLTQEYLIDLKVSKQNMTPKQTLQVLVYYLMGLRSEHQNYFKQLKFLSLYNPRKNVIYKYDLTKLDKNTKLEVETEVIGY